MFKTGSNEKLKNPLQKYFFCYAETLKKTERFRNVKMKVSTHGTNATTQKMSIVHRTAQAFSTISCACLLSE